MASLATVRSSQASSGTSSHQPLRIVAAFAAVYLIWGSTYFAIAIAIDAMPPFLMAGVRFLLAGGIVYVWLRLRGSARPTWSHWGSALVIGGLLLVGGNGGVVFAEQYIPSGLAALLVAMVPIYMALLDWLRPGGRRPTALVALGLVFGFAGIFLLIGPDALVGGGASYFPWILIPLFGSLCWAMGSLYSRSAKLPAAPLMGTALEMLAGGALLLILGLATGEAQQVNPDKFTVEALLAFGFLVVFGSIVAFSAYIWLLRTVSPARVSTYAYVNPVVALFLGSAFRGEPITSRTLVAAAVILVAVAVITGAQAARSPRSHARPEASAESQPAAPESLSELPQPSAAWLAGEPMEREQAGAARR
jgi:drug/metabolite transporter (DMT)-like permease